MIKNTGLAAKLIILILTSTTVIFIATFSYNYLSYRNIILKELEDTIANLALATVFKIETVLRAAEKVPLTMRTCMQNHPHSAEDINRLLKSTIQDNPDIFGSAIAFAPYAFDPQKRYYAPYCYRRTGAPTVTMLGSESYHYFDLDWYQIPRELDRPIWTEPYFDEGGGNIIMSTFSVPFYRGHQNEDIIEGIITADISLLWLQEIVSSVKIYSRGYAFLISRNGKVVTHPKKQLIMQESIFSIAEDRSDESLRTLGRKMIHGESGFTTMTDFFTDTKSWLYYAPVSSTGWSLAVIVPEDDLLHGLRKLTNKVFIIGMLGFILLVLLITFISDTITKPLGTLADKTVEIARGNLDVTLPTPKHNDEIGHLTNSFAEMRSALKEYIADLAETTAAKERIESELKIAHTIQMSFLPKRFPPFPEKDEFDIFATLQPAKEVGGDLYDFFLLDDHHLFFCVGDVSDKGVPAALFMAVTKTLLKGLADVAMQPSEILEKVNAELSIDNDSMMFVTLFCGILNIKTGELTYSNAGHNPPVVIRRGSSPDWLSLPRGLVLGAMEDSAYSTNKIVLAENDMLLVYTDGVTEAMNGEKKLYSSERLLKTVEKQPFKTTEELVHMVMHSVNSFSGEEPQTDDITILAIQRKS